eukprot:Awhi_evm1s8628
MKIPHLFRKNSQLNYVQVMYQHNLPKDLYQAYTQNGEAKEFKDVEVGLFAIGRVPNVEIDLEKAGVTLNKKGFIE